MVASFHHTILNYADELAKTTVLAHHSDWLAQAALEVTRFFLSHPEKSMAGVAAQITSVVDQTHQSSERIRLARPLGLADLLYLLKYFFYRQRHLAHAGDFSPGYSWFAGSMAVSGAAMRLAFYPVTAAIRFKKSHGRQKIYHWWAKLISRETL
jgi:hypothetical protein